MATTFKRWTTLEIDMMIECLKKKKSFEYISTRIERSTYAIKCKFETYVFDKVNSGVSYEDLIKEFELSESKLKEFYQIQLQRHNEKNKKDIIETKPTKSIKKDSNKITIEKNKIGIPIKSKESKQSKLNIPNITQNILSNNINQFNMILDPYITFYENIERLKKISNKITKTTYDEIINIINQSKIDDTQILSDLKKINLQKKIPVKSSSETESESESKSESESESESESKSSKSKSSKSESSKSESSKSESSDDDLNKNNKSNKSNKSSTCPRKKIF